MRTAASVATGQATLPPQRVLIGATVTSAVVLLGICRAPLRAEDWPTWRHDAGRTGAATASLPGDLQLHWRQSLPKPAPAWPEDPRLHFDSANEPVVVGRKVFVGSAADDAVRCFDSRTGELLWIFFAGGPVRFAPTANRDRLYFGSDDGRLYCLDHDGNLIWELPLAIGARRAIGSQRVISVWPVRGGPLLDGDTLYLTVGVWPFEGVFLYTVDVGAATQPGAPPKFTLRNLGQDTPQGYLAKSDELLFIPCGRAKPICLEVQADQPVSLKYDSRGKTDVHVQAHGRWLFHGDKIYDTVAGKMLGVDVRRPAISEQLVAGTTAEGIVGLDLANPQEIENRDRRGKVTKRPVLAQIWALPARQVAAITGEADTVPLEVLLIAGNRLFGAQGRSLFALELDQLATAPERSVSWTAKLEQPAGSLIAADDRLLATDRAGTLYCFAAAGAQRPASPQPAISDRPASPRFRGAATAWESEAAELKRELDDDAGYALVLGVQSGGLVESLLRQTRLKLLVVDNDPQQVALLRAEYAARGLYGSRVVALVGAPATIQLPPYFATAVVSERLPDAGLASLITHVYASVRPYGGLLAWPLNETSAAEGNAEQMRPILEQLGPQAELQHGRQLAFIHRRGALPGSANWTHEYGTAANTLMSADQLVRAPLGVLWFGGPAADNDLFFNRHYWGPGMAVLDGRMYIQGPRVLSAVDVYTGRVLWQLPIEEGVSPGRRGNFFERVQVGYHFLAASDSLYFSDGGRCLRLDPATGRKLAEFKLPGKGDRWGRMRVWKDLLIVAAFREHEQLKAEVPAVLIALNRHTGEQVWATSAGLSAPFVAIGGDKVFYFDGAISGLYDDWKRRGQVPEAADIRYLKAIDARTGKQVWERSTSRVVTWLSYSAEHDVLVASNKLGIDAYDGSDGNELWQRQEEGKGFRGHPESVWDKVILWNDRVIDQRGPGLAYNIRTGEAVLNRNPLTGEEVAWKFTKEGHHCNYAIASPHLLTFRAGSAGFLDLESCTTSRLNGFRSGCRNSLIPANGVLNSPNFAHGCICSYSLFTSLALVHVPDAELWTYSAFEMGMVPLKQVGLNLGAPGDRRADNGTLWLDYPEVGGPSPRVQVRVTGPRLRYFRTHTALVESTPAAERSALGGLQWVGASGAVGLEELTLQLNGSQADDEPRTYRVRLLFVEPEPLKAGERVFDVLIGEETVIHGLDVLAAAGASNRLLIQELPRVAVNGAFKIRFRSVKGQPICCGVELIETPPDTGAE